MAQVYKNWGRNFSYTPSQFIAPVTEAEIVYQLIKASESGLCIRPAGSRYSYNPLIATEAISLSLDNYTGIISIDHEQLTARVRAGTKICDLQKALDQKGYGLLNLGDINQQTIAGLLSTGSHGTGIELGIVGTQVKSLKLIKANGEILHCSEKDHPDLFKAALVSLGTLGIISEVELKIVPKFNVYQERFLTLVDEVIKNYTTNITTNRYYEFFWLPHTRYCLEKKTNLTDNPIRTSKVKEAKKYINDYALENGILWLLCEWSRRYPEAYKRYANKLYPILVANEAYTLTSLDCFATPRLVVHDEIEYAIPLEYFEKAMNEIVVLINQANQFICFPVEVRCSRQDDIYLSPNYKQDCVWIAVHTYHKDEHEDIFKACEQIFLKYKGRPHWGKFHYLAASDFSSLYPRFNEFNQIRAQLDPQEVFLNDYLRLVLGETNEKI